MHVLRVCKSIPKTNLTSMDPISIYSEKVFLPITRVPCSLESPAAFDVEKRKHGDIFKEKITLVDNQAMKPNDIPRVPCTPQNVIQIHLSRLKLTTFNFSIHLCVLHSCREVIEALTYYPCVGKLEFNPPPPYCFVLKQLTTRERPVLAVRVHGDEVEKQVIVETCISENGNYFKLSKGFLTST